MSYIPEPVTRIDKYLAYIAGNMDVALPDHPITRKEHYLAAWAEKSGFEDVDVTGEPPLTLENAIGKPLKGLRIYGKSKQVTTTGAQLLDYDNLMPDIAYDNDGALQPNKGYVSSQLIKVTSNSPYTISGLNKVAVIILQYSSEKVLLSRKPSNTNGTYTTLDNVYYIGLTFYANVTVDMLKNVMLNAGSTSLPWEPYTGGKPSPSPDYPQEIESAGSGGKIGIEVRGKNLMDFTKVPDASDLYQGWKIPKKDYESATVTLFDNDVTANISEVFFGFTKKGTNADGGYEWMVRKGEIKKREFNSKYGYLSIFPKDAMKTFLQRFKILVEIGTIPTAYEPYHELQSMSISTPNGLPGIPVSSGGNYTDADGRQWICDEVDFARGVYVQRVWKGVFDGSDDERWEIYNNTTYAGFYLTNVFAEKLTMRDGIANTYKVDNSYVPIEAVWIGVNEKAIYIKNSRFYDNTLADKGLSNFKASLVKHPMTVMTYLNSPIESPLTSDQLAAYKQLHTYKGTTIIDNDAGAYMSVKYEKMK